jgi:hypothetical protein
MQYGGDNVRFPDNSIQNTAPSGFGFKNRIINGAMMIDQRNAGASVTPANGQYLVDRWCGFLSQASKYTVQQNAGSVTPPAGFSNYLGVTSSSAYSVGTGDYFFLRQYIEGFNFADTAWGTASASPITISFWVRSSLTGTFGGALSNSASNRSYPFTYTISASNTWEQKSVTIAGDTSGTWIGATNGVGVKVDFAYGVGSTYSGTAGAWAAGNYVSATGATSVVGTNGATFYITGVQLEKGSTATSFDYRPYGTELALCYRYYQQYSGNQKMLGHGYMFNANTMYRWGFPLNIEMRASPTAAFNGDIRAWGGSGPVVASATSTINTSYCQTNFVDLDVSCAGVTSTAGLVGKLIINTSTASISLSAEL